MDNINNNNQKSIIDEEKDLGEKRREFIQNAPIEAVKSVTKIWGAGFYGFIGVIIMIATSVLLGPLLGDSYPSIILAVMIVEFAVILIISIYKITKAANFSKDIQTFKSLKIPKKDWIIGSLIVVTVITVIIFYLIF